MLNNKLSRNDDLTKEFYKTFLGRNKNTFCNSTTESYQNGELITSQQLAVIKLKNWRPISLLSFDTKRISKMSAERLKKVLPSLISKNQAAYVKERLISEGDRLISDILEISDNLQIKGFLMTLDIEKSFDFVNHLF